MRIGHGYDVHRLTENRKLILGGVEIPYMGDIGKLFPDNDPAYSGADSLLLLRDVCERIKQKGFRTGNIDATVIAQAPKLRPYIDTMRKNIAYACDTDIDRVNVKATTEEKLGFTGSGEGISAHAVCILEEI